MNEYRQPFIHLTKELNVISASESLQGCATDLKDSSLRSTIHLMKPNIPIYINWLDKPWLATKSVEQEILLVNLQTICSSVGSNVYLDNIIKHVPCYIFWKNADLKYLGCNQLFAEAAGIDKPENIIGKTDYDLPWAETEADMFRADDKLILQGEEKLNYEETQQQADGTFNYVIASKAPLRTDTGDIIGVLGVYSNITELKTTMNQANEARIEAEKANNTKSEFVAIVSHELRTPLNGILGLSESMLERKDIPSDVIADLELINASGKHLAKIVSDLLEYSSLRSVGQTALTEVFSVTRLVNEIKSYYTEEAKLKKLNFLVELDVSEDTIVSDEQKLRQIIVNLLTNAFKFTLKGFVKLSLSIVYKDKNELLIRVQDSGIGMKRESLKKIYDKFIQVGDPYNRTESGLGLGLAITKEIITMMKGTINVESIPNKGTTFTIRLPIDFVRPSKPKQNIFSDVNADNLPKVDRVLVIEDNKINQRVAQKLLSSHAKNIEICDDGLSGVDKANENNYDMIFVDINLPDIKGTDVAKKIRGIDKYKNIPIIALTAHASEEDKASFFRAGIDDAIFKPLTKKAISDLFTRWADVVS